jgi:hypothetical protein
MALNLSLFTMSIDMKIGLLACSLPLFQAHLFAILNVISLTSSSAVLLPLRNRSGQAMSVLINNKSRIMNCKKKSDSVETIKQSEVPNYRIEFINA